MQDLLNQILISHEVKILVTQNCDFYYNKFMYI